MVKQYVSLYIKQMNLQLELVQPIYIHVGWLVIDDVHIFH